MADKLIYKGGATVVGHTGTEIELVLPTSGALHRFPRWWNKKGTVAYIDAAIFTVKFDSGTSVRLVVPTSIGAHTLEIRHDGFGNFTFPVHTGFERVAVIASADNTLYREYQFAKISGGSVLTRTITSYPHAPAPKPPEVKPAPVVEKKEEAPSTPKRKPKKKIVVEVPTPEVTEETKED